jgi:hypothetical protein
LISLSLSWLSGYCIVGSDTQSEEERVKEKEGGLILTMRTKEEENKEE